MTVHRWLVSKGETNKMQQIVIYWWPIVSQHVSGIFMPIIRRSNCVPLPIVVCTVVAVVMLESQVASCVHCVENVACEATFSTQCTRVEILLVTNKSLFVASSWSHLYLLLKRFILNKFHVWVPNQVAATSIFILLIMNTCSVPHAQTPNCWHSHTHTMFTVMKFYHMNVEGLWNSYTVKLPNNKLHRTVILDTLKRALVFVTVNAFTGSF